MISNIRHIARTTLETPQQMITQSVARMDPICAPLLPQAQTLRRETRRVRRQLQPSLPIVTCAADVILNCERSEPTHLTNLFFENAFLSMFG